MQTATAAISSAAPLEDAKDLIRKKQYDEATALLTGLLESSALKAGACDLLCDIGLLKGDINAAVRRCMDSVRAEPSNIVYLQKFVDLAGKTSVTSFDPAVDEVITACLRPDVDCSRMQALWASNLRYEPGFLAAYNLRNDTPHNAYDNLDNFRPLLEPRFLRGIKNIVACMPVFEKFVTRIRRHLLDDHFAEKKKLSHADLATLAGAMAHYSLHTDYILDSTEEEDEKAAALRAAVESGGAEAKDPATVAVLGCYTPLFKLGNAAELEKAHASSPLIGDLVRALLTQHRLLREIAETIEPITPITAGTSEKVREQYEEFPYPRWRALSPGRIRGEWSGSSQTVRIEGHLLDREIDILNAGCGTGHEPLYRAVLFPKSRILAIDLSRASIAYAVTKAREYNITNVEFRHGDILKLGAIDKRFDLISSAGVLHHMEKPIEGWRVLAGLLKPGGVLSLGLYSRIARRRGIAAREIALKNGFTGDAASMRTFRKVAPQLLDRALMDGIRNYTDYYTLNMFRDLLFHVQEHNYDIPEIAETIKAVGLEFAGFCVTDEILAKFRKDFPGDPEALSLENWDAFERRNPDLFSGMYDFWCRKPS